MNPRTITIQGREVDVYDGDPTVLAIVLHGGFGSARQAAADYRVHELGWTTVYVNGTGTPLMPSIGRAWNCGPADNWWPVFGWPAFTGTDDVGYIETVARHFTGYSTRVVIGHSAGGALAQKVTVERPELFTHCASVAGYLVRVPRGTYGGPPVYHVHGTNDANWRPTGGSLEHAKRARVPALAVVSAYFGPRMVVRYHDGGHPWPAEANAAIREFVVGGARVAA